MKKAFLIIGGLVSTLLIVLVVAGIAYAQSQKTPDYYYGITQGYGRGMMGGFAGQGVMMGGWRGTEFGPLHAYMIAAMAEEFGLTPEELESLHDQGKTIWDYALEQGMTEEEFREKMVSARAAALEKAVDDGVITQAQADWMLQHRGQMWPNGPGFGPCHGGGWFGGGGPGWNSTPPPDSSDS